ncbi:mediator of RNA polymerase II transcription subunit 15a isoform X3 [Lactuca sativa]|uniref:mediator of RNA polymerase II transcription subunit 15a isoform X3 n=1 Tax=Lactuca sativa TaxID=4236 RepID=UPI0022B0046B|nr:mediator of RNA polymerase II transcription subunit 15a isoform X3 [Lactuca sativa]
MDTSNWRFQLQAASRRRMVNRIVVTLKRHLPYSGQEGLDELNKIAVRFEEKIYNAATSPVDYLQKISLKMQSMEPSDWRAQLQPDSRQRIVNKIMDTLMRCLPDEGIHELKEMADRLEGDIYTAATTTSQSDYLRKISLKMLTMEARSQKSNYVANSVNPSGSGSQVMQQVNIQGFPLPICVPSYHPQQGQQLFSSQTMHNNIISNGKRAVDDSSFNIMENGEWRAQLQPDSRQRIVNKILDTLKRHLPFSGHEGLNELVKIAVRFEEKIYTAATSQSDYLRMISLKMLSMESRSLQNANMPGVGPHFQ